MHKMVALELSIGLELIKSMKSSSMCRSIYIYYYVILLVFSGGPSIIKWDHDVQHGGSLESGISACELCMSSGAWRHAPQIILFILSALKSLFI